MITLKTKNLKKVLGFPLDPKKTQKGATSFSFGNKEPDTGFTLKTRKGKPPTSGFQPTGFSFGLTTGDPSTAPFGGPSLVPSAGPRNFSGFGGFGANTGFGDNSGFTAASTFGSNTGFGAPMPGFGIEAPSNFGATTGFAPSTTFGLGNTKGGFGPLIFGAPVPTTTGFGTTSDDWGPSAAGFTFTKSKAPPNKIPTSTTGFSFSGAPQEVTLNQKQQDFKAEREKSKRKDTRMSIAAITSSISQTTSQEGSTINSPITKLLLLVSLAFKKGSISVEEKGKLKDHIITNNPLLLSALEVFEIDQDFEELIDTLKRVCKFT